MGEGGVVPQAGCNLSAVFDGKQTKVAVALQEHEVVCCPDLFGGDTEGEPGICEARFGEGSIGAVCVTVFFGLGGSEVGSDSSAPGGVVVRHF